MSRTLITISVQFIMSDFSKWCPCAICLQQPTVLILTFTVSSVGLMNTVSHQTFLREIDKRRIVFLGILLFLLVQI